MNFITFASPHLGSSGNKQVILICFAVYITSVKSISLLFPVLTSYG